jgi:hypothetical protein
MEDFTSIINKVTTQVAALNLRDQLDIARFTLENSMQHVTSLENDYTQLNLPHNLGYYPLPQFQINNSFNRVQITLVMPDTHQPQTYQTTSYNYLLDHDFANIHIGELLDLVTSTMKQLSTHSLQHPGSIDNYHAAISYCVATKERLKSLKQLPQISQQLLIAQVNASQDQARLDAITASMAKLQLPIPTSLGQQPPPICGNYYHLATSAELEHNYEANLKIITEHLSTQKDQALLIRFIKLNQVLYEQYQSFLAGDNDAKAEKALLIKKLELLWIKERLYKQLGPDAKQLYQERVLGYPYKCGVLNAEGKYELAQLYNSWWQKFLQWIGLRSHKMEGWQLQVIKPYLNHINVKDHYVLKLQKGLLKIKDKAITLFDQENRSWLAKKLKPHAQFIEQLQSYDERVLLQYVAWFDLRHLEVKQIEQQNIYHIPQNTQGLLSELRSAASRYKKALKKTVKAETLLLYFYPKPCAKILKQYIDSIWEELRHAEAEDRFDRNKASPSDIKKRAAKAIRDGSAVEAFAQEDPTLFHWALENFPEYLSFCQEHGLNPNDITSWRRFSKESTLIFGAIIKGYLANLTPGERAQFNAQLAAWSGKISAAITVGINKLGQTVYFGKDGATLTHIKNADGSYYLQPYPPDLTGAFIIPGKDGQGLEQLLFKEGELIETRELHQRIDLDIKKEHDLEKQFELKQQKQRNLTQEKNLEQKKELEREPQLEPELEKPQIITTVKVEQELEINPGQGNVILATEVVVQEHIVPQRTPYVDRLAAQRQQEQSQGMFLHKKP